MDSGGRVLGLSCRDVGVLLQMHRVTAIKAKMYKEGWNILLEVYSVRYKFREGTVDPPQYEVFRGSGL